MKILLGLTNDKIFKHFPNCYYISWNIMLGQLLLLLDDKIFCW